MKTIVPAGISFLVSIAAMGFVLSLDNPLDDRSASPQISVQNPDPSNLVSPDGMTWLSPSGPHPGVWIDTNPITQSELNRVVGQSDFVLVIAAPTEPALVPVNVAKKYCQTARRRLPNEDQLRRFARQTGRSRSEWCSDQPDSDQLSRPFRTIMTQAEWRRKLRDEDANDPVLAALR